MPTHIFSVNKRIHFCFLAIFFLTFQSFIKLKMLQITGSDCKSGTICKFAKLLFPSYATYSAMLPYFLQHKNYLKLCSVCTLCTFAVDS